ncbi:MAG: hypothetical protein LBR08_04650, partial [Bacteroidales bacterium]|nr:hypothetical protein [Bacteroidales bacterium]
MRTCTAICLVFLMAHSCSNPYAGYAVYEGIYYKLLKIGEQDKYARSGEYVTIDVTCKTMRDSVFFSGVCRFGLTRPEFPGAFAHCFALIGEQDSAEFIVPATSGFFEEALKTPPPEYLHSSEEIKIAVRLREIQSREAFLRERQTFLRWAADAGEHERHLLREYVRNAKIDV